MTKAQYKVLGRLRKKQINQSDVEVVECSESCCVIYLPYPGLYLTYNNGGKLVLTETTAERDKGTGTLHGGKNVLQGEMGSGYYPDVYDDDTPF